MSANAVRAPGILRILVVDDYPRAAESMALWLRKFGHEVKTAIDGMQAVESAERFLPDVILLDIAMPKLNGYEVAKKIRAQAWGKTIVLIALSAFAAEEDRQKSREAGFDEHLLKPSSPAKIRAILASYFATKSSVQG